MPANALDRNWGELLDGLDDNNEGAIDGEDVRAITGYSRHSSLSQAFGDTARELDGEGVSNLWSKLPEPNSGISYLRLQRLYPNAERRFRTASGHLSTSAAHGVLYVEGDPNVDGATQPRQFAVDWKVEIDTPHDTLWGVSLWRLKEGAEWPDDENAEWDVGLVQPIKTQPIRTAFQGISTNGTSRWSGFSSGSAIVTLDPGDTVVPVLEYYGAFDVSPGNPQGTVRNFTIDVASHGPVDADWESSPESGTTDQRILLQSRDRMLETVTSRTDQIASGGRRVPIEVVDELPETDLFVGRTVWLTTNERIYVRKSDGWAQYFPAGENRYEMSYIDLHRVTGPNWTWDHTASNSNNFALWERHGNTIHVRVRLEYVSDNTGNFTHVQIRPQENPESMPPPPAARNHSHNQRYEGVLSGQLEDTSSSGGVRYPISGMVRYQGSLAVPVWELRPSSPTGALTNSAPVNLSERGAYIMLQFSYITDEDNLAQFLTP